MGWLSVCLFALLISGSHLKPLEQDEAVGSSQEMESYLSELFMRKGRQMDEAEQEDDMENEVEEKNEVDAVTDGEEVKRFNDYMDAVYRRMNAALRAKLMDPMELNLDSKSEKKGKTGKKNKRVTREADVIESGDVEVEEAEEVEVDRMGEAEKSQKKNKKKGKKNGRKGGKKSEKEDENEMEKKNKNKSGKNKRKEAKQQRKAEKAAKKAEKLAKKQAREEKRKNKNEGTEELSRRKRNKQSNEKKNNQKRKNKSQDGKARGSLSGIATLRRSGDVSIVSEEDHKVVTSEFTVGPLQLEVSKSFGDAKQRNTRSAKASTDVMKGVMILKVKPDGSAHVKKVVFKKPDHVDVSGSITEKERKNESQLRNSFNRSRGLAATKILRMARYVLKSTEISAEM